MLSSTTTEVQPRKIKEWCRNGRLYDLILLSFQTVKISAVRDILKTTRRGVILCSIVFIFYMLATEKLDD